MKFATELIALMNCFSLHAQNPAPEGPNRAIRPQGPQEIECAFLNVYSVSNQTVSPGSAVFMEGINASSDSFDVSTTPVNGQIVFNKSGIYEISWNVEGKLTSSSPEHSYSFGLTLDNVLVPGSVFGAFTSSPDASLTSTGNCVIIAVARGQLLRLVNTSIHSVDLISIAAGSSVPNTSASINIAIQADL